MSGRIPAPRLRSHRLRQTSLKKPAALLESLDGRQALSILKTLAQRRPALAREIESLAAEELSGVDTEDLAGVVRSELESLRPEDVWDRSGTRRDGYVDPGDAAWAMVEEALQPFQDDLLKLGKLSLAQEAELTCQGILKGIYDFDTKSPSDFKDWAEDAPAECFGETLRIWKSACRRQPPLERMRRFVEENCPKYAVWALRQLRRSSG